MKTAIYIEDGVVQLVLTTESKFEKNALSGFAENQPLKTVIFKGGFYDCHGGWKRQGIENEHQSIIIKTEAQKNE